MRKFLPMVIILSLLLASCGAKEEQTDKLQVYASFYAMYDFARTIGGENADVHLMCPPASEPHDYEPKTSDMAKLTKSDVFIYNGMGMESWAEKVAKSLPETVYIACASENINPSSDPHVWLSPYNAQKQLEMIYKAFSTADSENSQEYLKRLTEYSAKIDVLEQEYENADLNGKKLFVTHAAYGYLCDDFGMEQISLEGIFGDSDPSPAQMAKIVEDIKSNGAKYIFYDPLEGDKMANAVANEAGIEALPLCTFEGDGENRDYILVMEENLRQLQKVK